MSFDPKHEHESSTLVRETRSLPKRLTSWLSVPGNIAFMMAAFAAAIFALPDMPLMLPMVLEPLVIVALGFAYWSYRAQSKLGLPLCFPMSSGATDPNELHPATHKPQKAKGIIYLGNDRVSGEEVWLSDDMARKHMMFLGTTGAGKALSNDTPVLTPHGWLRLGDLRVGDTLCLPGGKLTTVKGVFPQGRRRMHGIDMKDGVTSECCDEHLWEIRVDGETRVARTDEIISMHKEGVVIELPAIAVVPDESDTSPGSFASSATTWVPIRRIVERGMKESTCILVDSAEHLFIIGDRNGNRAAGLVTHNTEFLLSVVYNALIHGSGFIYVDGKADSSLYGKIYSMARMRGREDDVRVINFQTGAKDIFGAQPFKMSNTVNPFAVGSSGMVTNLVVSLMSSGNGKGDIWSERAISFVEALMKPLVFLRDNYGLLLDVEVIRNFFDLKRLEDLAWRDEDQYPGLKESLGGMEAYLNNLPTYDRNKHHKQSETAYEQHGYITMQLVRTFNSLADTYGYIMKTPLAEIDFVDVFLNRRILVVLLPALEKSPSELQNLGKIIVASIKATMAVGLGARLEGSWAKILDAKPTNSPSPFMCVLDEYGYYAVEGFAVVPAQARSLGFSAIFAGQDLPAFQKSSEKEADSTLANTNTKFCGKLICTKSAEYFTKLSGQAYVTRVSSFENKDSGVMGYTDTKAASVEKMDRVTLEDMMRLDLGQWILWHGNKILRVKSFFSAPPKVRTLRVNRLLKVARPQPDEVDFYRKANQNFLDGMGGADGIAVKVNTVPFHDFMTVTEGMKNFSAKPGIDQSMRSLIYFIKEATQRQEAFDRMLETLRGNNNGSRAKSSPATVTFDVSNEEPAEPAGGKDAFGDMTGFVNPGTQAQQADMSSLSNVFDDMNFTSAAPFAKPDQPDGAQTVMQQAQAIVMMFAKLDQPDGAQTADTNLSPAQPVDNNFFDSDVDLTRPGVLADDDSDDSDDSVEWNFTNKFDTPPVRAELFKTVDADADPFTKASLWGVSEIPNLAEPTDSGQGIQTARGYQVQAGQGLLNRDNTEQGLFEIERRTGATESEASCSASIVGNKIAEMTKYPMIRPSGPVTLDQLTEVTKRFAAALEDYNKSNNAATEGRTEDEHA